MPTRIKFTTNTQALLTNPNSFVRKFSAANMAGIRFSKFNHILAMHFFDNKIGKNLFTQIKQSITSCSPCIYISSKFFRGCTASARATGSIKNMFYPVDKTFVGIINFKESAKMRCNIAVSGLFRNFSYPKTSFSINNASHISQFSWFIVGRNIVWRTFIIFSSFFHMYISPSEYLTTKNYYTVVNEESKLVQAERLSGKTFYKERCDSLTTIRQGREEGSKNLSRLEWYDTVLGHKSNRMVLNTMVELLGMSFRETEDKLLRDMLVSTATSINATGGNNGDMPTQITASDIEKITTNLVGNNAFTVTDHVEAQDKIGTAPIANSFVALAHTDITPDLDAIPRFIPTNEYSQYEKRLNSEWGSYRKMRFFVSPNGAVVQNASAMGNDVYPVMMCGLKAYGCIKQQGASARFIYRDPMFSGALAQNGTVSYKFASAQTIFQDEWIQKLNVTVTS